MPPAVPSPRPPALRAVPTLLALLVLLVLLVCGCGGRGPAAPAASLPPSVPSPGRVDATSAVLGPTDAAWVQLMIPMIERALPMLDLAARRGSTPEVRELASSLATGHRADLERLRALHREAGLPEANPHEGHDMPGMVTQARLEAMRQARGAAFDRLFLAELRAHLTQSVTVTQGERRSGSDARALALAASLEHARTAQLGRLPSPGQKPAGQDPAGQ